MLVCWDQLPKFIDSSSAGKGTTSKGFKDNHVDCKFAWFSILFHNDTIPQSGHTTKNAGSICIKIDAVQTELMSAEQLLAYKYVFNLTNIVYTKPHTIVHRGLVLSVVALWSLDFSSKRRCLCCKHWIQLGLFPVVFAALICLKIELHRVINFYIWWCIQHSR